MGSGGVEAEYAPGEQKNGIEIDLINTRAFLDKQNYPAHFK